MEDDHSSGNFTPPKTLVNALSLIQKYFLMESDGAVLRKEFFDVDHVMGFSNVAVRSALIDSFVWILGVFVGAAIYYIQESYLTEKTTELLFWQVSGSPVYVFTKIFSFGRLAFSTVMCCLMARYYIGVVPKKAILTVFATRITLLLSFALVNFAILGFLYKYAASDAANTQLYYFLMHIHQGTAQEVYSFIGGYFRNLMYESAIISLISSAVAIVLPFITIVLFRTTTKSNKTVWLEDK